MFDFKPFIAFIMVVFFDLNAKYLTIREAVNFFNDVTWRIISNNTIVEANKDSWIKNSKYTYSIRNVIGKAIADCITDTDEFKNINDNSIIDFNIKPKNYTAANWNAVVLYNYLNILKYAGNIDDLYDKLAKYFKGYEDKIEKAVSDIKQYDKELHIAEWMKKFAQYGEIANKNYYELMRLDTLYKDDYKNRPMSKSLDCTEKADWMISPLMYIKGASYGEYTQYPISSNKKTENIHQFFKSIIQKYKHDKGFKDKVDTKIKTFNDILNSPDYEYISNPINNVYLRYIGAGSDDSSKQQIDITIDGMTYYINQYRFRYAYGYGYRLDCDFISSRKLKNDEQNDIQSFSAQLWKERYSSILVTDNYLKNKIIQEAYRIFLK